MWRIDTFAKEATVKNAFVAHVRRGSELFTADTSNRQSFTRGQQKSALDGKNFLLGTKFIPLKELFLCLTVSISVHFLGKKNANNKAQRLFMLGRLNP